METVALSHIEHAATVNHNFPKFSSKVYWMIMTAYEPSPRTKRCSRSTCIFINFFPYTCTTIQAGTRQEVIEHDDLEAKLKKLYMRLRIVVTLQTPVLVASSLLEMILTISLILNSRYP